MTADLVPIVNRLRSRGYKYEQIKDMLVKMGNSAVETQTAIEAYVKEMCGTFDQPIN